jgi:type II secretory pathway pseudopilin PulG
MGAGTMKTRTRFDRSKKIRRGGFTLVELMIVITIIIALMALTASAIFKYLGSQQSSNTQSTLDRTQSQLGRAWSKVKDDARNAAMSETPYIPTGSGLPYKGETTVGQWIQTYLASNATNPSDPNVTKRKRVIYIKLRLRQAFPMNFNEAVNPAPLPPLQGYVQYLKNLGISGSSTSTAPYESSACLLMALQRGAGGAGINPSELTAGGAAGNYAAALGSLPYLTDAWSRPIYFTRVPVGSALLNPTPYPGGGQSGANDPLDPEGLLNAGGWASSVGKITPQGTLFVALTQQQLAGGDSSFKQAPMLASGGPDNWMKPGGALPFHPVTFAETPGGGALFSNP